MARSEVRRGRGEGSLFYREDRDRWVGRVIVDGTPRTVSARTKTDARKQLNELRRTADDGLPVTPGAITLEDLLITWADKALPNRNLSPSRLAGHQWAIAILIDEIGSRKVRTLTADQVEAAFLRRAQANVATTKRLSRIASIRPAARVRLRPASVLHRPWLTPPASDPRRAEDRCARSATPAAANQRRARPGSKRSTRQPTRIARWWPRSLR